MNMLSTRIVTSANSEFTIPAPTSASAPAASPMCEARSSASWSSLAVRSKFSLSWASDSFSANARLMSATYSGRLSTNSAPWRTAGGMRIAPMTIGAPTIARYTIVTAKPRFMRRDRTLTGPDAVTAMKHASTR
jgi:hypothetical protein